jgi:hypothetical protein
MSGISSQLVTESPHRHSLLARMALVAVLAAGLAVGIVAWATDGFSTSSSPAVRVAPAPAVKPAPSVAPNQSAINDLSAAPGVKPAPSVAPNQSAINDLRQVPGRR